MILGSAVGKLDDIAVKEGPDGGSPTRDRLVGIRVRHGAVVGERKLCEPLDDTMRRRRAKAHRAEAIGAFPQEGELSLELPA